MEQTNYTARHFALFVIILICVAVFACGIVLAEMRPPANFTPNVIIPVEKNMTLGEVATELYDDHVIRSPFFFKVMVTLMGGKTSIGAGDYVFLKRQNTWTVARRLVNSEQDLTPVRVTLPEGLTVREMAPVLNAAFSSTTLNPLAAVSQFNEAQFLSLASTSEGYLFPDTYLFMPNDTPATVISGMNENFNQKMLLIEPQVDAFIASTTKAGFHVTPSDIVIMASIIEKEATSTVDRQIISGILWKRLEAGQLLEVDPPLQYIENIHAELTLADLATTSPYNTYKYKGLPPTPIDNPGLDALTDAVTPTATTYWYYLSDSTGAIHYSATYAGQLANQAKYIGN